jgi:serine/threonine protein kinase
MAGLQGKIFSGYQLAEQVNGGGIADVYRAHPTNPGGREAIVKIVHPEFAQQKGFLPHFREIVKLSKSLANHPHILPLLASGEEGGYLYLVTPFVASGTLKDWIGRGERLGASDAGPFFRQLCDALGYAHSLGIVHSNIKPSNIFLFEGRHVLLGDFGMLWDIRMLREFAQMDVTHSAEAVEYLAPEVASNRATQQSDIYSVGAVLFAAITGQAPFHGGTLGEVLSAHERRPVPHLQQINPRLIPAMQALDAVTQRALAKRPEHRFPSAIALSQAIEATLSQVPAMVYTPPVAALPQIPQLQKTPIAPPVGRLMSQAGQLMSQAAQWLHPGPAGGEVPGAAGGSVLQALNPPFPPLQSSETVEETMEHGRVNLNPTSTEAPTGRFPAPQAPLIGGPSDQTTLHVPAPAPSRSLQRPPAMIQGSGGIERNVSDWSDTSGGGNAGMLPAISPSSRGPVIGNRDNGANPAGPGSPPGYQQHYSGWENSGGLYSNWVSGGLPPPGIEPPGSYIDSGNGDGWTSDSADDDAAAWDKLTSQRYAVVNPGDPYRDDGSQSYDSYGPMRNQIGHTSEYTDARHAYGDSRSYGAADSWGERYVEGYTGEYTGSGYASESESRELDIWPKEKLGHTSGSPSRGFSPTQLGLPRLTNPSLDSGLPQAWQDIVSGVLPPAASNGWNDAAASNGWNDAAASNGWNDAAASNGTGNIANWSDGTGFSESLSAYSAQMPQPQAADWFELDSRHGNRRNPGAPLIPFEEQRVWTTGLTALGRRSRWTTWLIAILLVVAVINLGLLVVMRPDLCPSSTAHSCQAISAKAHKLLPFLGGQSIQPAAQLTSSPTAIPLRLATNKKTATAILTLTNAGPTTAHWTASSGSTWLTLDKTSGVLVSKGSVTLTLVAGSAGLSAGPHTTAITITSGSQVLTVPVTVTVTAS